ncbi:unnamed protein product [Arctogadus glacialis]
MPKRESVFFKDLQKDFAGNVGIDSGQDVAEHLAAAKCYWWSALGYRAECFTHARDSPHTCPISVRLAQGVSSGGVVGPGSPSPPNTSNVITLRITLQQKYNQRKRNNPAMQKGLE